MVQPRIETFRRRSPSVGNHSQAGHCKLLGGQSMLDNKFGGVDATVASMRFTTSIASRLIVLPEEVL